MIGNDVVDLALSQTQSNWRRTGYLDKIFTDFEKKIIENCSNSDEMVWVLWSRKEAVYKIILQKGGKRGYYPTRICCLNSDLENGMVLFESEIFYTKTMINGSLIHSLAVDKIENFNKILPLSKSENLIKKYGIPFYEFNSKLHPASKSHHGQFEKIVYLR